ncbi:hypothetical protein EW146_g3290 [Bondarzewia mesenterica]|uniref:Major facilitator superfamily (MFS) profile domain-containing protein n=1 Tax=Bondarzewia mesenterica TaxID=1095465 RepID=A0A4S4LYH3_9AGAM|nr:hypothetical protein EW146_g3290 [Bondarzewia mesenterica]
MSPSSDVVHLSAEQDVGEANKVDIDEMLSMEPGERVLTPNIAPHAIPEDAVDDSALDTSAYYFPSFLSAPSTRVRRRSELAFARPTKPVSDSDHADKRSYELPALSPHALERSRYIPDDVLEGTEPGKVDSDMAASSGTTPAVSVLYADNARLNEPSASQRAKQRRLGRVHFAALCWCFFLEGWNDGSTGPLLPALQKHYRVGFAIVSMIFVLNTIGFVTGATANVHLSDKFGFGKNAGANGFVGSLKKNTGTKLCFLHGSYGLGAFAAPLAATQFAEAYHWSYHYFISLGIAVSNSVVLGAVFRLRTQDEVMAEAGQEPGEVGTEHSSKYRQILGLKVVHYLALFSLIYVGWIVTFIIRERQGGPSAGYISSGFFGGLTLGRILLISLNRMIGERRALFIYAIICIGLEATIWAVPSLVENAVAVSFIGLLMGPMYPILVNHAQNVLPRWLLTGSIGWIAGIGQAGSAILPLVTGVLASRFGISSLQPLVVVMMGIMIVVWALVPKAQRRVD